MKFKVVLMSLFLTATVVAENNVNILDETYSEGLAIAQYGEKEGFVDEAGNLVIPFIYDWVSPFSEGLAIAEIAGKHGFIDRTGATVIPFIYDGGTKFTEGVALVEKDGERYYIDKTGKTVIKGDYIGEAAFTDGLSLVSKDDKYGFINHAGNVVVPIVYDYADPFEDGMAYVISDDTACYINTKGEKVKDAEMRAPNYLELEMEGEDGQKYNLIVAPADDDTFSLVKKDPLSFVTNDPVISIEEEREYPKKSDQPINAVLAEQQPQFPGGNEAMYSWLAENIKYPAEAGVARGRVNVAFVVNKDGEITDVSVARGDHPAFDKEAVRVVSSMPRWEPARNNGEPVSVSMFLPITFQSVIEGVE